MSRLDRDFTDRSVEPPAEQADRNPGSNRNSRPEADAGKPEKRKLIGGFDHAWDGLRLVLTSQRNMRFHAVASVAVILLGLLFGISATEFALLALTITVVFAAEVINTAIEAIVDLASPERHPLAKIAKDCAAGAVLVCAIGAVFVGALVFWDEVLSLILSILSR